MISVFGTALLASVTGLGAGAPVPASVVFAALQTTPETELFPQPTGGRGGKGGRSRSSSSSRLRLPKIPTGLTGLTGAAPSAPTAKTSAIPDFLAERLEQGPLTREEAREIVELLADPVKLLEFSLEAMQSGEEEKADPELVELVTGLFESSEISITVLLSRPQTISVDARQIRSWFAGIDLDASEGVDFLELRDQQMASLRFFRALDRDNTGEVDFFEFAEPVTKMIAEAGVDVRPELLDWLDVERQAREVVEEEEAEEKAPRRTSAAKRNQIVIAKARAYLGWEDPLLSEAATGEPGSTMAAEATMVETPGERATRIALEAYPVGGASWLKDESKPQPKPKKKNSESNNGKGSGPDEE